MERKMGDYAITRPASAYVVSCNIISALGFSTEENMEALWSGKTGITLLDDPAIYPEPFMAGKIDPNRISDFRREAGLERFSELESLAILSVSAALKETNIDLTNGQCLLILSTTKGNIAGLSGHYPPEQNTFLGQTAQAIAGYFGMKNIPLVISNACVSGVSAIETGARMLREQLYEEVVIVGADSITAFTVSGFQAFKSISPQVCKPYDADRDGLSIGEGVATIILTNNESHLINNHRIRILGGATSNDANHISGPSRTGDGLYLAIENALLHTGIDRNDIDFINLHGTATLYNDEMESKAIRLSGLSDIPANSLKAYWGHTLGASGIMETIACIESLKSGRLISCLGYSRPGVPEPMNIITKNSPKEIHTFLKTASGFGGFNSAIIVSDRDVVQKPLPSAIDYRMTDRCKISDRKIEVNGNIVFEEIQPVPFSDFIKSAFKHLEIPYPKFYKMDHLSKLGFTAVQYLLKANNIVEKYDGKKIAVLFYNASSSLDTDIRHQQSIADPANYFPSPAVFVYTLPNIVIGEICIKEKIQGETNFFVMQNDNPSFIDNYLKILFQTTPTEAVILGKVECLGEKYEADVSLVD